MISAEDVRDFPEEYLKELVLMEIDAEDLFALFKQYEDYSLSLPRLMGSWFERVYLPLFLVAYFPKIDGDIDEEMSALAEICKAISLACGVSRQRGWKAIADCLIDLDLKESKDEDFLERTDREKIHYALSYNKDCQYDKPRVVRRILDCSRLASISACYCVPNCRQELGFE